MPSGQDFIYNSVNSAYTATPTNAHKTRLFVFSATTTTASDATRGSDAGQKPPKNIPGVNKSFATSAANAAGGI